MYDKYQIHPPKVSEKKSKSFQESRVFFRHYAAEPQTACLVFNPIMVEGYAALFSCTAVVQASDLMTASM